MIAVYNCGTYPPGPGVLVDVPSVDAAKSLASSDDSRVLIGVFDMLLTDEPVASFAEVLVWELEGAAMFCCSPLLRPDERREGEARVAALEALAGREGVAS